MPRGRRRIYPDDRAATRARVRRYRERQRAERQGILLVVDSRQQASPSPQSGPRILTWDSREQPDPVLSPSSGDVFGRLQETLEAIPVPRETTYAGSNQGPGEGGAEEGEEEKKMTVPSPAATCPFCRIAAAYPPIPPSTFHPQQNQNGAHESAIIPTDTTQETHAHLVLSTPYVLAFLDIMPLTRGHVLVVTRDHYEKLKDMGVEVSREIGQWLPIISRVLLRTVFGTEPESEWSWNVVQNNGIRAAQQVPHVHFHVIPRPPLDPAPTAAKMSFVMFGRGQRDELDDEEGEALAKALREELAKEVRRVEEREGVDLNVGATDVRYRRVKGKL